VAELDGAGNVVSRFVYGTKSNVPDYVVKGGATYRIFSDHLGSVRLVVNVATGEVAQRLEYGAFGVVLEDTAPGFQPFGFAGGLYEPTTGLVRFGARDYDAEVGRWTSQDPIWYFYGDPNQYSYAINAPTDLIDPDGLNPAVAASPPGALAICLAHPVCRAALFYAVKKAWDAVTSAMKCEEGPQKGKGLGKGTPKSAKEQHDEILEAQRKARQGKGNKIIEGTGRSKQREKAHNKLIRTLKDLVDWDD